MHCYCCLQSFPGWIEILEVLVMILIHCAPILSQPNSSFTGKGSLRSLSIKISIPRNDYRLFPLLARYSKFSCKFLYILADHRILELYLGISLEAGNGLIMRVQVFREYCCRRDREILTNHAFVPSWGSHLGEPWCVVSWLKSTCLEVMSSLPTPYKGNSVFSTICERGLFIFLNLFILWRQAL